MNSFIGNLSILVIIINLNIPVMAQHSENENTGYTHIHSLLTRRFQNQLRSSIMLLSKIWGDTPWKWQRKKGLSPVTRDNPLVKEWDKHMTWSRSSCYHPQWIYLSSTIFFTLLKSPAAMR